MCIHARTEKFFRITKLFVVVFFSCVGRNRRKSFDVCVSQQQWHTRHKKRRNLKKKNRKYWYVYRDCVRVYAIKCLLTKFRTVAANIPYCVCTVLLLDCTERARTIAKERERAHSLNGKNARVEHNRSFLVSMNFLLYYILCEYDIHSYFITQHLFSLSLSHFMSLGTKRNSFTYNFHNSFHAAQAIIILDTFLNISFPHSLPGAFWPFSTSKLLLNIYF